jgi:hypothetical protein
LLFFKCFAWYDCEEFNVGISTSFVTDLQIQTLNYLEQLLSNEYKEYKTYIDWPPSQQQECVLISVLHLLTLQVNISLNILLNYF